MNIRFGSLLQLHLYLQGRLEFFATVGYLESLDAMMQLGNKGWVKDPITTCYWWVCNSEPWHHPPTEGF